MSSERWHRIEAIYHAALSRPPRERVPYLAAACAGDDDLCREVESLLAETGALSERFLDQPAAVVGAGSVTIAGDPPDSLLGARLGHYHILGRLGAGGMGEVYRARDTKLGRDVAIKMLPTGFITDPERLARFEREARVLASLNHPHIGAIYGVEDTGGVRALVLELVDGQTLADRIRLGPVSLKEALSIAGQLVAALDAAHERGIVHRDFKPANIKVTSEGVVKVLDFGIARASSEAATGEVSRAPTVSLDRTREGLIMGTAAYMSPEQARGKPADKRTDIWAFGCVLYEMLAGRAAFARATVSDTIAAILEREPDWALLPPPTPVAIRALLNRCLEKEPSRRLRDIGDARIELDGPDQIANRQASTGAAFRSPAGRRSLALVAALIAAASAAATVGLQRLNGSRGAVITSPSRPSMTLAPATADNGIATNPALSADAALLAYASDRAGKSNLDIWVQPTSGGAPHQVTHDAADELEPTFSPDGRQLAYRSEREGGGIYIVPTFGGEEPRLVVSAGRRPRFSPDGRLIAYWTGSNVGFNPSSGSYRTFVISLGGGAPVEILGFTGARYPVWAPDGQSLLLVGSRDPDPVPATYDWWRAPLNGAAPSVVAANELLRRAGVALPGRGIPPDDWRADRVLFSDDSFLWSIRLDSVTTKPSDVERLTFGTNRDIQATTAASGLIAFTSASVSNSVWALPIDSRRGVVRGVPLRLTNGAGIDARPSADREAQVVAYRTNIPRASVHIKNLKTHGVTDLGVPGSGFGPAISPDGTNVAYEDDVGVQIVSTRGGASSRLCQPCRIGEWSTDRAMVVVRAENNGGRLTWIALTDGAMRDLIVSDDRTVNRPFPSPDGRLLAFRRGASGADAIMIAPLGMEQPVPRNRWIEIVPPEADARPSGWSPDGSLLYFVSSRDGTRCLYAQRVNPATGVAVAAPFAVEHFHGSRIGFSSGFNVLSTGPTNAVAGDLFFYDLSAWSANIWTLSTK